MISQNMTWCPVVKVVEVEAPGVVREGSDISEYDMVSGGEGGGGGGTWCCERGE